MYDTNAIWMSLAETGKAQCYVNDYLWDQLLEESREEGARLQCKPLANGLNGIYLRRRSQG